MEKVHFDDLTKINVPFGLLDDDTQVRLKEWKHGQEYFDKSGWETRCSAPFVHYVTYRAKPAPLTQDTVPWHLLEPRWQWYARQKDGYCSLFSSRPILYEVSWYGVQGSGFRLDVLKDHKVGTVDWKDSLQQRPEGV